jgi:hypothetical protein
MRQRNKRGLSVFPASTPLEKRLISPIAHFYHAAFRDFPPPVKAIEETSRIQHPNGVSVKV